MKVDPIVCGDSDMESKAGSDKRLRRLPDPASAQLSEE